MYDLLHRADALDPGSYYPLDSWVPQVGTALRCLMCNLARQGLFPARPALAVGGCCSALKPVLCLLHA